MKVRQAHRLQFPYFILPEVTVFNLTLLVHVSTIKLMVRAIVTKSGNSYALRVPKRYIDDNKLKLGDEVTIEEPLTLQKSALEELVRQGKLQGAIKAISNPVEWQRQQRRSSNPWEEVDRDSAR